MADISLRDYLAKLDTLLNDGATDEVIHHCRHILKHFPKNADVYRCLGRALIYAGSWDKAGDVFRRVLSVYPDDYIAHVGLSEAYLNLKRVDEAIWHLERAFEQEPNNQEIIESLRELYRKHRRVEQAKVQLTAGAAARQYVRNGLYGQAIDTLQKALAGSPERVDLRLLLARTYNEGGYPVEAGETALEVLRALPDCLEANRILTELWLSVKRPSDAQRYLSHIQSVDPYLALEIAQGETIPDDIFRLEELDYRTSAREEIIRRTPDWLQEISPVAESEADLADWMSAMPVADQPSDDVPMPDFEDDLFSTELPDDWLEPQPEADQPRRSGLTGLLATLNEPEETETSAAEPEADFEPSFAEISADLFPQLEPESLIPEDEAPEDELPAAPVEAETRAQPAAARPGADDPLAWLHQSGIELVDEPQPEIAAFDEGDIAPVQDGESDPLAWLQDYGGEELIVEETTSPQQADLELESAFSDEEEERPAQPSVAAPPAAREPAADPLDWLADETLLEEALSLETLTGSTESAEEYRDWAQTPDGPAESDGQGVMSEENQSDWMKAQDDKPQPDELPLGEDWFSGLDLSEPTDADAEMPGKELEWLTDEPVQQPAASELADDLDWFSELAEEEVEEAQPAAEVGVPDWLSEMQPEVEAEAVEEEPAAVGDEFAWLGGVEEEEAEAVEPAAEVGVPDWLTAMQPEVEAEAVEEEPAAVGDEFAWLGGAEEEEAEAVEPAAEASVPDWLSEMQPEEEAEAVEEEPAAVGDEFAWLGGAEEEEAEEAQPAVPDWLSEMQPEVEAEAVEEEPAAVGDEFAWLGGVEEEEAEEAQPAVPDWLSEMQPEVEAEAVEEEPAAVGDEFAWLGGAEEEEAEEAQPAVPDWLSEMQPEVEAEAVEEEPAAVGDEFAWLGGVEEEEAEEAQPAVPDWLSEMQPEVEAEAVEEEPAAVGDEFAWLGGAEEEEAEEAQPAVPDWLSEMQPEVEAEAVEEEPAAVGDEFAWLGGVEEEEAEEAQPAVPDWLSEIQPEEEAEAVEEEPAAVGDEFAWLGGAEEEEAEEAQPAVPDWLSEMQPEVEAEAVEEEPAAVGDEFAWLGGAEEEEAEAVEPAAEPFDWGDVSESHRAETVPDWLSDIQSADEMRDEPAQVFESEFSWIDDINAPEAEDVSPETPETAFIEELEAAAEMPVLDLDLAEEDEVAPAPASNAPDWLNAMVPGLDVNYAAPEDEPIEQTYAEDAVLHRSMAFTPEAVPPRKDFEWLVDLVEEETQQVPAAPTGGRRFVFTRQPAWLRQPTEQHDETSLREAGQTGEPDAQDDSDLPPWLR